MSRVRSFLVVLYETVMGLSLMLPRFSLFNAFKSSILRLAGAKIGKGVIIYPGVWIMPGRGLTVGDHVDLSKDVLITTSGGVTIGDRVLVGYRTQILSANHSVPPAGFPIPISGDIFAPVKIERDSWIGANCIVLPGVRIGVGAVVGAGSVVTKNIPDNAIAVGVPARVIRYRESSGNA